jgi:hypothetical protein
VKFFTIAGPQQKSSPLLKVVMALAICASRVPSTVAPKAKTLGGLAGEKKKSLKLS